LRLALVLGWLGRAGFVVDGGEVPSDQQYVFSQVQVCPVQSERFAAAHTGAEQPLEQVGELVRVLGVVVVQERGGLAGIPADPLADRRPRDERIPAWVAAMSRVRAAAPKALERAAPAR